MSKAVSVIVPTKDSAETLEACLSSVRGQRGADLELVVIDNFSYDATPDIARRYATQFQQAGPERSRQRNLGARAASGNWLLFIDSDMVLHLDTVRECLSTAQEGFNAVIIPEVSKGEGFWASCKALERACYVGDDSIEAARFIQRPLFESLGGFDENLVGEEDWDLTARIRIRNGPVGRTRTPIIHQEGRLRVAQAMQKKFYYGRTMTRYIRKHPRVARSQLTLFRPAFFRRFDLLRERPILAAGMIFLKACEFAAGAAGAAAGTWAAGWRR